MGRKEFWAAEFQTYNNKIISLTRFSKRKVFLIAAGLFLLLQAKNTKGCMLHCTMEYDTQVSRKAIFCQFQIVTRSETDTLCS